MTGDTYFDIFICVVGLLWHGSMKWEEHRRKVAPVGPIGYLAAVPAQASITLLSTVAAFSVTWKLGWMNPGLALACGYMGSSVAENIAERYFTHVTSRKEQ